MPSQEEMTEFIIWQQHWVGYKPKKFARCATRAEADDKAELLNCSPSGQWFHYSVEARELCQKKRK